MNRVLIVALTGILLACGTNGSAHSTDDHNHPDVVEMGADTTDGVGLSYQSVCRDLPSVLDRCADDPLGAICASFGIYNEDVCGEPPMTGIVYWACKEHLAEDDLDVSDCIYLWCRVTALLSANNPEACL